MRTKPFQYILSFLALLGTAHGSIAPIAGCTAQAWVRAPDLTPNAIVQGDARVKISAECPAIENVSLGLRFKERSFVKALRSREDVKWLNPEPPSFDFSNMSIWASMQSRFANKSVEAAYEETITNKDLWIVREEERVVFETMQPFNMGSGNHDATRRDAVQDFSILVPSTNFPPALDIMGVRHSLPMERELVDVEWIYEYFVQMAFANGTTREISARFTAFQPLYDPADAYQGLTSATVVLKPSSGMRGHVAQNTPIANYSIEISADSGLAFFAGTILAIQLVLTLLIPRLFGTKNHVVTAVITRTGFARTFSAPLTLLICVMPNSSPKWAAEYDMSDVSPRFNPKPTSVLRATSDRDKRASFMWQTQYSRQQIPEVTVIMPNSTSDEIQANKIVTTTSAAFTISLDVDDTHIPTFQTYYQTLANSVSITLETPRREDEDIDPDDPSGEHVFGWGPQFEEDEEAWVPWEKKRTAPPKRWHSYSGGVTAVVHPTRDGTSSRRCLHASTDMSGQVVLSDEKGCEQRSFIHYLDEGARGPTFVDRNAIHELLAKDPTERELHAPILEPVMSFPPEGEELAYRYYRHPGPNDKPRIYVGETWAKKVVDKDRY